MNRKIPAYVIALARQDGPRFIAALRGANHIEINNETYRAAYTHVDSGALESHDREAYVCAIKAIICGLAA